MANQLNYAKELVSLDNQRPFRPTEKDQSSTVLGNKTILFGTTPDDNVELWVYNVDGSLAGYLRLAADDPAFSLYTVADTSGGHEFLNIDFAAALNRMSIVPGRYSIVANFLRDEVGGLEKYKLYIDKISPTRTELRLRCIDPTSEVMRDIYEFVVPSVPKIYAQGLVDQLFEKNRDVVVGESITPSSILSILDNMLSDTSARIVHSGAKAEFDHLINYIREDVYHKSLQNMADDISNRNIQSADLNGYIQSAFDSVLESMEDKQQIDPRFEII